MGPKVGYFAGFRHHRLVTMCAFMHVYRYLLFESEMKTGFEQLLYACKKDKALLHKHKKQRIIIIFTSVIDVLLAMTI